MSNQDLSERLKRLDRCLIRLNKTVDALVASAPLFSDDAHEKLVELIDHVTVLLGDVTGTEKTDEL